MKVLYEDNHILVVEKAPGMLTQPDDSGRPDLETFAKKYVKDKFYKPGAVFLHAVHRLDRPVGGIVVFARTSKALSRLNESLRNGKWNRRYRGWVEGKTASDITLEHLLLRQENGSKVVDTPCTGAKASRLTLRTIKKQGNYSLVEVELETGRHHQIRLQLSANQTPILGDARYGSKIDNETIALEHFALKFPHPTLPKEVTITLSHPYSFPEWMEVCS